MLDRTQEVIAWTNTAIGMPDCDETVLAAINIEFMDTMEGPHEPVVVAIFDGEDWIEAATGGNISHAVVAWAHMPTGPFLERV